MALSGVYTVCLTFSLLTQIVHILNWGNKIKKFDIILTIRLMDQMDMQTKYTNDCVTNFFLLSAT